MKAERMRSEGRTLDEIAAALGCSRQAVRTALEQMHGTPQTRYPRTFGRRDLTDDAAAHLRRLYDECPPAPRARPGHRDTRGPEGRALAEACGTLARAGVPMSTLSSAMRRGNSYVTWLLGRYDLKPPLHDGRSTARRTRPDDRLARTPKQGAPNGGRRSKGSAGATPPPPKQGAEPGRSRVSRGARS